MWAPFCRCRGAFWEVEAGEQRWPLLWGISWRQSPRAILKLFPCKKVSYILRSFQAILLSSMFSSFTIPPISPGGQVDVCSVCWHRSHFLLPGLTFPWRNKLPGDRTPVGAGRWFGRHVWTFCSAVVMAKVSKEMIHVTKTLCIVLLRRFQMI